MKTFLLAGAALGALLATAASAQPGRDGPPPGAMHGERLDRMIEQRFAEIDADHDGAVTRDEFTAFRARMWNDREARRTAMRDREFAQLDANHDGMISHQEFAAPPPPEPRGGFGAMPDRGPPPPPPPGGMPPPPGDHATMPPPGGSGMRPPRGGPDGMRAGAMRGGMMSDRWFDLADANHDGRVTLAEAKAAAHRMMTQGPMGQRPEGGPDDDMPPPPLPPRR